MMTGRFLSAGNYEPNWAEQLGLINDFRILVTHTRFSGYVVTNPVL